MKPRVSLLSRLVRSVYGSVALVAALTAAVDIPVAYGVDTTPLRCSTRISRSQPS